MSSLVALPDAVAADGPGLWRPSQPLGATWARPADGRRRWMLAGIAAAHLGLLLVLAQALRLPLLPPALSVLSVQLVPVDAPAPPAAAPQLPPGPQPAAPVLQLQPPVVVLAELTPATRSPEPSPAPATPPALPPTPAAAPKAGAEPAAPAATPVPPPPAPAPERQVSISQVEYLTPPVLAYPLAARRLREQGQVLVRVRVDEIGRPEQVLLQQSSGSSRLDEAALAAAAATRFKPYRESGVARPFWVLMPLVFALDT